MTESNHIALLLAPGFEETEAVAVADVLRRAEFDVQLTAVGHDLRVAGSHGISLVADRALADVNPDSLDCVVLPGGMPGASNLAENEAVCNLIRNVHAAGRIVAAICAAPIALHAAGVLEGRRVTSYPTFRDKLTGATTTDATVERDGNIITSQGPGTALVFGLELVRALGKADKADKLAKAMLVRGG